MNRKTLVVNTRCLHSKLTGVQRYTKELLERMANRVEQIEPRHLYHGIPGHAWEQLVLPFRVGSRVLWSPSNTGPLAVFKQIVTIHDVVPMDHPEWLNARFRAWYRFLLPKLAKRVAHIITISEFTKKRIIKTLGVSEDKITVIYNGVDKRFQPCPEEKTLEMRSVLKLPDRRYVLSLGSLEPRKNIHRLLCAWERILPELPNDIWLVLGGAKGSHLLFRDVKYEIPPRVYLTGHVDDRYLPSLYSGAMLFVYPSLYEGFGLPVLEAMASGTSVITSNVTALPEVAGNACLLVNPKNVDEIAKAITKIVKDSTLREEMQSLGIKRAKNFSWDKCASQTYRVTKCSQ